MADLSRRARWRRCAPHWHAARRSARGNRRAVQQRRADADGNRACPNPVTRVVERDATGRHQLQLRKRASYIREERRSERRCRKDLHDVRARFPRGQDLRGREAAGQGRDVVAVTDLDDRRAQYRTDDKTCAGVDDAGGGLCIEDRAGPEHEITRQRRRQTANQIDGAGHGHRHLECANPAVGERLDHGTQALRFLHANDGDDAHLFDRRGHVLSLVAHRASHPPSTASTYPCT